MLRIIVIVKYFYSKYFYSKKQSRDSTDLHFSLRPLRIWPHWTYVLTGVYFWFMSSRTGKHIGNRAHFPVRHKTRGQHVPDVWGDIDISTGVDDDFSESEAKYFSGKSVIEREGIKISFFHAIIIIKNRYSDIIVLYIF